VTCSGSISHSFTGDPTNPASNELLFGLACLVDLVVPLWLRVHLLGTMWHQ
jgi:hypothetical protein